MKVQDLIKSLQGWFILVEKEINSLNEDLTTISYQVGQDKTFQIVINDLRKEFENILDDKEQNEDSLVTLRQTPPGLLSGIVDFIYNVTVDPNAKTQKQMYKEKMKSFSRSVTRRNIKNLGQVLGIKQDQVNIVVEQVYEYLKMLVTPEKEKLFLNFPLREYVENIILVCSKFKNTDRDAIPMTLNDFDSKTHRIFKQILAKEPQKFENFKNKLIEATEKLITNPIEYNKLINEINNWNISSNFVQKKAEVDKIFGILDNEARSEIANKLSPHYQIFQKRKNQLIYLKSLIPQLVYKERKNEYHVTYEKYLNGILDNNSGLNLTVNKILNILKRITNPKMIENSQIKEEKIDGQQSSTKEDLSKNQNSDLSRDAIK